VTKSFLAYPTGVAGSALLLLRMSVAAALIIGVCLYYDDWVEFAAVLTGALLVMGLFTRLIAGVCAVVSITVAFKISGTLGIWVGLHGLSAIVLSMLGAGGYSIDGQLFGRHVITFRRPG